MPIPAQSYIAFANEKYFLTLVRRSSTLEIRATVALAPDFDGPERNAKETTHGRIHL